MKKRTLSLAVAAGMLGTALSAFAQPVPGDSPDGPPPQERPGGHGDDSPEHGPRHRPDGPGMPPGHDARRPVPHSDWHRGERVPPDYRDPRYVVDDWRAHDLEAPPAGYQWLQVNGEFVLVAITTGVIASILLAPHR